jgi:hypothetical protein
MPVLLEKIMQKVIGFEWDEANEKKIAGKHGISAEEAEQVFINKPFVVMYDAKHSQTEDRYGILGQTNFGRRLAVYFIIRGTKIRVISARGFHKKNCKNI